MSIVCGYVHVILYDFLIQQMTYSEENVPDGIITEEGQEGSVPVISSVQTIDATSTGKLSIHVPCSLENFPCLQLEIGLYCLFYNISLSINLCFRC